MNKQTEFTIEQNEMFQSLCNLKGYTMWYGSAFRSSVGTLIQAVEIRHKARSKDVIFVGNICLKDNKFVVLRIKGKEKEIAFDDFESALEQLAEWI